MVNCATNIYVSYEEFNPSVFGQIDD